MSSIKATQAGLAYSSQRVTTGNGKKITLSNTSSASRTTTSFKTTAEKNISTTTSRSTTFTGLQKVKTANFQFAARSSKLSLYSNEVDYSALRKSLNSNTGYIPKSQRQNYYTMAQAPQINVGGNNMNKYATAMMAVQLLNKGLGAIGSLNAKASATGTAGAAGASRSADTSGTAGLDAMKSAQDSTTLRGAIESAQTEKTQMQSELTQLEGNLGNLKAEADTAKAELEKLEPQVKQQEKLVKEKEADVDNKQSALDAAGKDRDSKLKVAQDMERAVGEAASNYTKASQALVDAQARLASTPATIMGPNGTQVPNEPAYSQAKQAVEIAQQQKDQAKTELETQKENHANAVKNYETAIDAYEQAAKDVQTAKDELETAKNELEEQSKKLNDLKKQESDANGKVKAYEDALDKQKELKSDIEKYDKEIKEQQERLTKLEQQEEKDLQKTNGQMDSLSGKITDRNEKIDTKDGLSFMEKRRLSKNEKNSEKYDELTDKRNELQQRVNYTKLSKMVPEFTSTSGTAFRQAEFGGETLYMVGAKKVTAEEYQAQLKAAQEENV